MNKTTHNESPISSRQHAETLRTSGFFAESVDCFHHWLEAHPKDAWSWAHCGAARASVGDHDGALADLDKAIKLKNGNYPWALAQKGEAHRVYVRDRLPWTQENLPKIELQITRSLEAFNKAIKQAGGTYDWAFAHLGAMHSVAYFIYRQYPELKGNAKENFERADDCFKRATTLNRGYSWAFAFHALLHATAKDYERSRELMGQGLLVNVSSNLHQNRAMAELNYYGGRFDAALVQGWLARQADPEDALVLYFIAQSLKKKNDPSADAAIGLARDRLLSLQHIVAMMLAGLHHSTGSDDLAAELLQIPLGNQNMESLFIALHDPVWADVLGPEKSSELGLAHTALIGGESTPDLRKKFEGGGQ